MAQVQGMHFISLYLDIFNFLFLFDFTVKYICFILQKCDNDESVNYLDIEFINKKQNNEDQIHRKDEATDYVEIRFK